MSSSVGMIIPNLWKNKMFQTTNQRMMVDYLLVHFLYIFIDLNGDITAIPPITLCQKAGSAVCWYKIPNIVIIVYPISGGLKPHLVA